MYFFLYIYFWILRLKLFVLKNQIMIYSEHTNAILKYILYTILLSSNRLVKIIYHRATRALNRVKWIVYSYLFLHQ